MSDQDRLDEMQDRLDEAAGVWICERDWKGCGWRNVPDVIACENCGLLR